THILFSPYHVQYGTIQKTIQATVCFPLTEHSSSIRFRMTSSQSGTVILLKNDKKPDRSCSCRISPANQARFENVSYKYSNQLGILNVRAGIRHNDPPCAVQKTVWEYIEL
ncbi:hypothetical protein, partial [uncultured Dubosiella sp.]|uniref:hypothetical protein n=1 Tax=uncultured Dubosiella sp. TaxID=1937011 RepID=UPI00262F2D8E